MINLIPTFCVFSNHQNRNSKSFNFGDFLNLRFNLLELSISCVVQLWSDQIGRLGDCFNCPLACFSLESLRCRALINGTRRAPCVAGKTNSGMTVSSAMWADVVSCWSISLVKGFPCLSLCLNLFGKSLFKLRKALLQYLPPSWTFWIHGFPFVDVNAQGLQVAPVDIFTA